MESKNLLAALFKAQGNITMPKKDGVTAARFGPVLHDSHIAITAYPALRATPVDQGVLRDAGYRCCRLEGQTP